MPPRITSPSRRPTVLAIGGSDSGGGAGIQADLKAILAAGAHAATALTCVTAQNPQGVRAVEAVSPEVLDRQIAAVLEAFPVRAIKTGMLYSAELITVVGGWINRAPKVPWVIDPVLVATSGARLCPEEALDLCKTLLFPRAALLTPNLPEAETLLGQSIESIEDMREAARCLVEAYGVPVLLKGGHLATAGEAIDLLRSRRGEWLLRAPRVRGVHLHGTGCTYASAIAAHLALGAPLNEAVAAAKKLVSKAILQSYKTGRQWVLNP